MKCIIAILTSFLLFATSCGGKAQKGSYGGTATEGIAVCNTEKERIEHLAQVVQYIADGDSVAFAANCEYPISRTPPLPCIKDSAMMVHYFNLLFDDSIRMAYKDKTTKNWFVVSWHGYMLDDGELRDEQMIGRITEINYSSPAEKKLWQQKVENGQKNLYKPLRNPNMILQYCFRCPNGSIVRIDKDIDYDAHNSNKECRMLLYDKGCSVTQKPRMCLYGHIEYDETNENQYYNFSNDQGDQATFDCIKMGEVGWPPYSFTINGQFEFSVEDITFIEWDSLR